MEGPELHIRRVPQQLHYHAGCRRNAHVEQHGWRLKLGRVRNTSASEPFHEYYADEKDPCAIS